MSFLRLSAFVFMIILLGGCVAERVKNGNTFRTDVMVNGATSQKDICLGDTQSVWVTWQKEAECIKYFAHGLKGDTKQVMVYIHPSFASLELVGKYITDVADIYQSFTPGFIQAVAYSNAFRADMPFIFIGRPGTFGSSGYHGEQFREGNHRLINAALNQIKEKYKVKKFIIAAQGSGSNVAASLLTWRNDINGAVLSDYRGANLDYLDEKFNAHAVRETGIQMAYDPALHIDQIPADNSRQIILLYNQTSDESSIDPLTIYALNLERHGHNVQLFNITDIIKNKNNHPLGVNVLIAAAYAHGIAPQKYISSVHNAPIMFNIQPALDNPQGQDMQGIMRTLTQMKAHSKG